MSNEKPSVRWNAKGKKFCKMQGQQPIPTDADIPIPELARSVDIPSNKPIDNNDPYGLPIDAELAIKLISAFHKSLPPELQKIILFGGKINISPEHNEIIETLVAILRKSAAITIDKNIILKTLSQPECEGIRFYLCRKTVKASEKALDEEQYEDFLSLVTVGVNKAGQDLHYIFSPESEELNGKKTQSLTGEYGHPPGGSGGSGKSLDESYGVKYVLLKYALQESKK